MIAMQGQPSASSDAPSTSASVSPEGRAGAFRAAPGGGETVNGGKLLIAAYAFVWVVLLLVVVRTFRRQSAVASQLDALESKLSKPKPRNRREAST